MKKNILIFALGFICATVIGVGADAVFNAKDIKYSNANTSATNVSDALDEFSNYQNLYKEYLEKYNDYYSKYTDMYNKYNSITVGVGGSSMTSGQLGLGSINLSLFSGKYKYFKITGLTSGGSGNCSVTVVTSSETSASLNTQYLVSDYGSIYVKSVPTSNSWLNCYATVMFYN